MAVDKSRKTKKIQEIIDEFESKCKMRTVDRIYEFDDEYVIETSTSMARMNLDPFFEMKKKSFRIKHHEYGSKEELPDIDDENMIYESKEVLEREASLQESNDSIYEELMKLIEEEVEN